MDYVYMFLALIGRLVIGSIIGVFTIGIILSILVGPTLTVGVVSAIVGAVFYYGWLIYKK
jgi:hypothetical protein